MAKQPSMGTVHIGRRGITVNRAYVHALGAPGMLRGLVNHATQLADDLRQIMAQLEAVAAEEMIPITSKIDDAEDADVGCSPGSIYVGLGAYWQRTDDEPGGASDLMVIAEEVVHAAGYKVAKY